MIFSHAAECSVKSTFSVTAECWCSSLEEQRRLPGCRITAYPSFGQTIRLTNSHVRVDFSLTEDQFHKHDPLPLRFRRESFNELPCCEYFQFQNNNSTKG